MFNISTSRTIGIRHRVKVTVAGDIRPTEIAIRETDGSITLHLCKEEGDELAFITEKLLPGDIIAMSLGGSGDLLAFATNRIAMKVGAVVVRIPPYQLKAARGHDDTAGDARLLAELAAMQPGIFFPMLDRDASLVRVREHFRHFIDSMKARIACEQRLRQRVIGAIYTTADGIFPEGGIEKAFDALKASDKVLVALTEEEKLRERDLMKALKGFDVFGKVFEPIVGVGPRIAARLIDAIGDIRRFDSADKLVAFCGVHLTKDKDGNNVFPRRRAGVVANWHGDARQALYLCMDQWNRRPDSDWGRRFRENKAHFRRQHPEKVQIDGKWRYTDAHIHKMAGWRTANEFVRWLYGEWWTVVDPEWSKKRERNHQKWLATGMKVFGKDAWREAPGSVKSTAMTYALGEENPANALTRAWAEYNERWSPVFGAWWETASLEERRKAVARYNVHFDTVQAVEEATLKAA